VSPGDRGSGSARAPWPHSSQEEPAFSLEGLPRRVRTRRSRTHQHRWRRPTRPNHRQHLNRHRPQQPRRVASQRSPRAAARPSSTSRSPLAESRRTDLEFACSRRCVSEAFLRTPKATELGSAGIRGRFEQAQRQSTRAPPAQHSKRSSHRTPRIRSANAPRAGSRSRRMKRSREFGMRTVLAIARSGRH
jgi:hypothetical protein